MNAPTQRRLRAGRTLRNALGGLCVLVLLVPSASAEDETVVAPKDESCPWLSIVIDEEPLFIRYQVDPSCIDLPPTADKVLDWVEELITSPLDVRGVVQVVP